MAKERKKPESRLIKKRSTFPVYIRAEAPDELVEFLNALKETKRVNDTFSDDIVAIINQYREIRKYIGAADVNHCISVDLLGDILAFFSQEGNREPAGVNEQKVPNTTQPVVSQLEQKQQPQQSGLSMNEILNKAKQSRKLGNASKI